MFTLFRISRISSKRDLLFFFSFFFLFFRFNFQDYLHVQYYATSRYTWLFL